MGTKIKTMENSEEIIQCFSRIAPYINMVTPDNIGISVWIGNVCESYVPAEGLDFKIKPGDKMRSGSAGELCMQEKERILVEISREKSPWGIPYIVNAMPFLDENENPVGCVITTGRTDQQDMFRNTSQVLRVASEQLSEGLQDLSLQSDSIVKKIATLDQVIHSLSDKTKSMGTINTLIQGIAHKTNILGINAAIEAARAGHSGLGFKVVAEEIRKLATQSADSSGTIQRELAGIIQAFGQMSSLYEDALTVIAQQSSVIHELTSSGQELSSMAQEMDRSVSQISML